MSVGVKSFRGKRLQEARLARGLYKNALADLIGVSGTAITRYEADEDKPQAERLNALAKQLNFPVEFFSRPEWPDEKPLVFWRSRAAETKYAREMTEQRMTWLCELFSHLEREVDFPTYSMPDVGVPQDFRSITPEMIEGVAEEIRQEWKLWDYPVPDTMLALENAGIPVVSIEISSEKQDGFYFRSEMLGRPFVGINTYNVSAVRARYDAAHELGHAVFHGGVTRQQARDPALHKVLENQAHRFAGAFIFPRSAFRKEVGMPTLDYFSSLKKRWGLSIAAMIYRAFDLGMIDETERGILYRNMTRRRWRGPLQEPFDSRADMPLERPRMIRRAVETVIGDVPMGRSGLLSTFALPEKEIEQIASLDAGFFKMGEVVRLVTPKSQPIRALDVESGTVVEFPRRDRG